MNITRKFRRASSGLRRVLTTEGSIRIQLGIAVVVLTAAGWLGLRRIEFIVLLLVVFSVLVLEGINTILERVIDLVEPRYREVVREIKDALAGLVLLAALGAVVIGAYIFWPHLTMRF